MAQPPVDAFSQLLQFCRALIQTRDRKRKTRYFCPFGTSDTVLNGGFDDVTHFKPHLDKADIHSSLAITGDTQWWMACPQCLLNMQPVQGNNGMISALPTVKLAHIKACGHPRPDFTQQMKTAMISAWPVHPKCGRSLWFDGEIVLPDPLPNHMTGSFGMSEPPNIAHLAQAHGPEASISRMVVPVPSSTSEWFYNTGNPLSTIREPPVPYDDHGLAVPDVDLRASNNQQNDFNGQAWFHQSESIYAYNEEDMLLQAGLSNILDDFDMADWGAPFAQQDDQSELNDAGQGNEVPVIGGSAGAAPEPAADVLRQAGPARTTELHPGNELPPSSAVTVTGAARESPAAIGRATFIQRFRSGTPEGSRGAADNNGAFRGVLPPAPVDLYGTVVYAIEDDNYPGFMATAWTDSNVTVIGVSDASGRSNSHPPFPGNTSVTPHNALFEPETREDGPEVERQATSTGVDTARRSGLAGFRLFDPAVESGPARRTTSMRPDATVRTSHPEIEDRPSWVPSAISSVSANQLVGHMDPAQVHADISIDVQTYQGPRYFSHRSTEGSAVADIATESEVIQAYSAPYPLASRASEQTSWQSDATVRALNPHVEETRSHADFNTTTSTGERSNAAASLPTEINTPVSSRRRPHSPDDAVSERITGRPRTSSRQSRDNNSQLSLTGQRHFSGPYRGSTSATTSTSSLASTLESDGGWSRASEAIRKTHLTDEDDSVGLDNVSMLRLADSSSAREGLMRDLPVKGVQPSHFLLPASQIDFGDPRGLSIFDTSGLRAHSSSEIPACFRFGTSDPKGKFPDTERQLSSAESARDWETFVHFFRANIWNANEQPVNRVHDFHDLTITCGMDVGEWSKNYVKAALWSGLPIGHKPWDACVAGLCEFYGLDVKDTFVASQVLSAIPGCFLRRAKHFYGDAEFTAPAGDYAVTLLINLFDPRPPGRLAIDLIYRRENADDVRQQLNPLVYPLGGDGPIYPAAAHSLCYSVTVAGEVIGSVRSSDIDSAVSIGGGWKIVTLTERMRISGLDGQKVQLSVKKKAREWEGGWFFGGAKVEQIA